MIPLRSLVMLNGVPGEVRGRQQGLECGRPFKRYDVLVDGKMIVGVPESELKEVA